MERKDMKPRIDGPIIPNEELGGLKLRTPLVEIEELFVGLGVTKEGSFRLAAPFVARYRLGKGEIEVAVDVRNGKIFKLIANQGYTGKLFDKITVGMSVAKAFELDSRLYYDEAEEVILCKGIKGVSLDVPEIDPPPNLVPSMSISSISVFADEILTLKGQQGDW